MVPAWCHDDKESFDEKIKTIDALFDELSTNVTSQSERIEPSEVGAPRWGGGSTVLIGQSQDWFFSCFTSQNFFLARPFGREYVIFILK